MKIFICSLLLIVVNSITAQTKSNDYFSFYKGGEKYLKPIKYVLFDMEKESEAIKRKNEKKIYFTIKNERFVFDIKKHKKDTCSVAILKTIKLENPANLQNEGYQFFKKKKEEVEKKKNVKLIYPPAGFESYFKVYVLEKTNNNKLIKYEVDWEYSDF
jgi:hypothetical protein